MSKRRRNTEGGSTLVALCLILPFLLVLISIFILVSFWLKNFWASQKICEDLVLSAQTEMASIVPRLLKLNPEILLLKKQRTGLKIKLAAAVAHGNAPAVASLMGQLKLTEARLFALWTQQNLFLQEARLARFQALAKFKNKTKTFGVLQSQSFYQYPLALGVTPDQHFDQPPVYKIPNDFLEKQRLELRWKQNLFQNGQDALLKIISLQNSPMRRACAASLEAKGRTWQSRLLKGKDSLNSSY